MNLSRRDFLGTLAMAPAIGMTLPALAQQSASLALAENAFIIGGQPRFLIGGSIDYFRCPHELWRDRLLKAKRAGLNAIATCVAWNFHEREEGVYDFSGDRDIGRFLDLCGELGL